MSTPDEPTPDLTAEAIAQASALAQDASLGDPFTLGDRTFTHRFLTIARQEQLVRIIIEVVRAAKADGGAVNIGEAFLASVEQLPKAVAIILEDQDPESTEAWLRDEARGVTYNALLDILLAQIHLNEVTPLLGKLLTAAGLIASLSP